MFGIAFRRFPTQQSVAHARYLSFRMPLKPFTYVNARPNIQIEQHSRPRYQFKRSNNTSSNYIDGAFIFDSDPMFHTNHVDVDEEIEIIGRVESRIENVRKSLFTTIGEEIYRACPTLRDTSFRLQSLRIAKDLQHVVVVWYIKGNINPSNPRIASITDLLNVCIPDIRRRSAETLQLKYVINVRFMYVPELLISQTLKSSSLHPSKLSNSLNVLQFSDPSIDINSAFEYKPPPNKSPVQPKQDGNNHPVPISTHRKSDRYTHKRMNKNNRSQSPKARAVPSPVLKPVTSKDVRTGRVTLEGFIKRNSANHDA